MAEKILEVRHLSKSFGANEVLRDIDFTVAKGDVTSHHRRLRLGQVHPAAVHQPAGDPLRRRDPLPRRERDRRPVNPNAYRAKVGMVFQSFNLFSNMTVLENCMVGSGQGAQAEQGRRPGRTP